MADERAGHGLEDGRRDIAGARSHQKARRRLKSCTSLHGLRLKGRLGAGNEFEEGFIREKGLAQIRED